MSSQNGPTSDRLTADTAAPGAKAPGAGLSLGQKGLIIIGLPVLIQLIFFFQIASQKESFDLSQDLHAREVFRQKELSTLYTYAFVDLLVGLGAVYFFTQTIAVRLKTLQDNTRRFVETQVIAPPLRGSDEAAQLDLSIHEMIASLKALEARKKLAVTMVNNDFAQPLNAVTGSIELLGAGLGGALDDKGQKLIDNADAQLTRLLKLTHGWLEKERKDAGVAPIDPKTVPLDQLVQNAKDSLFSLAQKANVKIVPVNVECFAYADEAQLGQLILLLLGNGLKSSPAYGTVKIEALQSPEWLTISVSDKGRGFAPEVCEKIFDRFQETQTDDTSEKTGTNLALAICKSIVQAHKGEIGVKSEVGKGSTFWFRIPASNQPGNASMTAQTATAGAEQS